MAREALEIVIIEDESDILELIEYHLQKAGYNVTGFLSTERVERFLEEENPDLMIVDRNLPGAEGSEFVAYLRELGYDIPVIFLTAKDGQRDLEEGFLRGGDDYMTKPFSYKELLLRIEAVLRRSGKLNPSSKIKYRDLILDTQTHTLNVEGRMIELTPLEFRLMRLFIKYPGRALERDFLRDEVWGDMPDFHDKTINVAMNRLKKKIDPDGTKGYIVPVWGVGYKLV
jgi:DNA-binding response OmpR family regulator